MRRVLAPALASVSRISIRGTGPTIIIKCTEHTLAQRRPPSSHHISFHEPLKENLDTAEPFYSEEQLNEFYQNLFLSGFQPSQIQETEAITPSTLPLLGPANDTIKRLERRFCDAHDLPPQTRLTPTSTQKMSPASYQSPPLISEVAELGGDRPSHRRLLNQLDNMIGNAETSYRESFPNTNIAVSSETSYQPNQPPVPLTLISYKDWFDLIRHSIYLGDVKSSQQCLSLMKRSAQQPPAGYYEFVLKNLAEHGRISDVEGFLAFMRSEMVALTENVIHQHAKAYVRSRRLSDACSVIYSYEESHVQKTADNHVPVQLPSQKTYTLVISSLLAQNQAHSRAYAWDLFAHMRYVAHPIPDAPLYATMLRACAYAPDSRAERALDLWTEMCIDNKIPPTRDTYNALILTCARASGRDKHQLSYAHDAFRFAREMLDAYRAGAGHLKPNVETFNALLESAKRTGDLARARWILAELVGSHNADRQGAAELAPSQDVMAHILQVYAAYQPPFPRRRIRSSKASDIQDAEIERNNATSRSDSGSTSTVIRPQEDGTAMEVPQSHGEVAAEATTLFERIVGGHASSHLSETSAFNRVELTTHLFNSYLSVHFAHSSLAKSRAVYNEIFSPPYTNPPVRKNARTFMLALQRCMLSASPASSRSAAKEALSFARAVWDEWINSGFPTNANMSPRTMERMWSSMIRVLALSGNADDAMVIVRDFASRYPPHALTGATLSSESRAPSESYVKYGTHARTHLVHPRLKSDDHVTSPSWAVIPRQPVAASSISASPMGTQLESQPFRPLVQLVSPTLVADPHIPPWLSFADVDVLHQRLLALQRWKDVGYLTWLTRAYAGTVRKRRDASLAGLKRVKAKTEAVTS